MYLRKHSLYGISLKFPWNFLKISHTFNIWRSHLQSDLTAKCWFWEKSVLWKKSKIFKICLEESKGSTFTHLIIFSFLKNTNAVLLQCLTKKKNTSFRSLCRYEKHVSHFFDEIFKNYGTFLVILLCNTNLPRWVKNPEKNNHFYESNFSKYVALDKIFSEIIIFNEVYQLFKFVPS